MKRTFCFIIQLFITSIVARCQITVPQWPVKDGPEPSTSYLVEVRASDGWQWTKVPVLACEVNLAKRTKSSFCEFDMGSQAIVRITSTADSIDMDKAEVMVRPQSRRIPKRVIDSKTIELQLDSAAYLSVEFNGDRMHNLHVFANPQLTEQHSADEKNAIDWRGKNAHDIFVKDASLIYFAPGVHRPKDLPATDIRIPSNCTVYLAPGAVVKARLIVDHAENVRIIGRGIVTGGVRGVEITHSRNVLVEGITFLNPQHYTVFGGDSRDITIRNIKSFSARSWSDGIDLMCCKDVTIDGVFMRNSDDCIALYNHRWWYWGGTSNVSVRKSTLWADVAHPINIGTHGDDRSETGETLEDISFDDCDILYARTNAAISVACGDKNHIRNIRFDNIRIEDIYSTALFGIKVIYSEKYNRAPGNSIDGIHLSNISYVGNERELRPSFITDYDSTHNVTNVTMYDIMVNGRNKSLRELTTPIDR
ncbi:MAG: glycosyl hydrolase family 28 protein [Prevotella sp.]